VGVPTAAKRQELVSLNQHAHRSGGLVSEQDLQLGSGEQVLGLIAN